MKSEFAVLDAAQTYERGAIFQLHSCTLHTRAQVVVPASDHSPSGWALAKVTQIKSEFFFIVLPGARFLGGSITNVLDLSI